MGIVNLDALMSKTFQFTLDGKLINCNQPSVATVRKFQKRFAEEDDDLDVQTDFVLAILSNNTSGVKFTRKQVEELPVAVQNLIAMTINAGIREVEEDPNS